MLISRKAICSTDRVLQSKDAAWEHGLSRALLLLPACTDTEPHDPRIMDRVTPPWGGASHEPEHRGNGSENYVVHMKSMK